MQSAAGPAHANKITQLYNQSQAEASLFEKIIRERGDKLPEISIPKVSLTYCISSITKRKIPSWACQPMARELPLPSGQVWRQSARFLFKFVTLVVHEQSAPAARSEAKEEGEVYVPPKEVELVDRPLKLSAPVRTTTVVPPPRVPEPEPAKKAAVSEEAIVRITGGDLPARKSTFNPAGSRRGSQLHWCASSCRRVTHMQV